MEYKRLYRSNRDAMVAGVAGGLAEYFNVDPTLIRLAFVGLGIVSGGVPAVMLYGILWLVVPRNPSVTV